MTETLFSDHRRLKYNFIVSSSVDASVEILDYIGEQFAVFFGGVTISRSDGFWAEDGNEMKTEYSGPVKREKAICISLLILAAAEDGLIETVSRILKKTSKLFGTAWTFVHTERIELTERHFRL